ncbi:MAG TPA: Phenylacetic acid catabolic protein [Thermoanaerobaculia bacterium]|nr:Phenylacetic acid catabolic protein [Thermoanaerobaculia bacterium]
MSLGDSTTHDPIAEEERLAAYSTETINPKYHEALTGWQKKNFPELDFLTENWPKFYPSQTPFQLFAKIGKLGSEQIVFGRMAGQPRFERAGDMVGNMFYSARDIIRAQASTELGSIQQHRLTLEEAPTDQMKMAVLRIMAEELRHGYQMFWVLDHDHSWKKPGHPDIASETMDELLSMELGEHVLDAFNIPFSNFLDNVVFATVIDLVGKYQLEMQKVFSYAPMARSMGPMLSEEGFHIGSGRGFLKELAVAAHTDGARFSIDDIQRTLNAWIPRGVEMFGNELGGQTAVTFGFKDRNNGTAQAEYHNEVREVVELVNVAVVQSKVRDIAAPDARSLVREVQDTGESIRGIGTRDLLFVPGVKFYRKRGLDEVVYMPYDVNDNLLSENGRPISGEKYLAYLATVLPEHFLETAEFQKYREGLLGHEQAQPGSQGS